MSETNLPNTEPLFERVTSRDALLAAFRAVKKNGGAPGIDGVTTEAFAKRLDQELLRSRLAQFIDDKRILRLIGMTLRSGVMREGLVQPTTEGWGVPYHRYSVTWCWTNWTRSLKAGGFVSAATPTTAISSWGRWKPATG